MNAQLDPQADLHLDGVQTTETTTSETITSNDINPRELSMDNLNSASVSPKPPVSLSGISGISSVAETLKGSNPASTTIESIPVIEQYGSPLEEVIIDDESAASGSNMLFVIVLILFLVSLAAAGYFLYQYFAL